MGKKIQPRLRFKGFTDAWEQRQLEDVADIRTGPFGSTLHAEQYVENGTPIITTEHFKGGELPGQKTNLPQVSADDLGRLQSYVLRTGDIVFSRVGSVDANALITPFQDGWLFSGRVLRVRTSRTVDSLYLHFELSTDRVRNDVISRAVGQTMPSINTEILKETSIYISSSIKEEQQIGHFVGVLDRLLTLHQRKVELLKRKKQAYLQQIFSQKLQFRGFHEQWEQQELREVVDVHSGMDYKHLSKGDIPVYGTGGYMLSVDRALSNSKDAIGIGRKGTIDKPYLLRAPFWTVDTLFYAIPREKTNLDFAYAIFQIIDWKRKDESTGVPSLSKTTINAIRIFVPKEAEQCRIGILFSTIDDLITNYQRRNELLIFKKNYYLQQLFV